MANSSIALISAKEFETARRFIPELSQHLNYEDWLDYQFGRMMGASLGETTANWSRSVSTSF